MNDIMNMTFGELRNLVVLIRSEHPEIVKDAVPRILIMTRGKPTTKVPVRVRQPHTHVDRIH